MRKINQQAVAALLRFTSNAALSANTRVYTSDKSGQQCCYISLHNSDIAKLDLAGNLFITTANYCSRTTLARLNALPGVNVKISKGNLLKDGVPWDGAWCRVLL
jgi:hypothetical protein